MSEIKEKNFQRRKTDNLSQKFSSAAVEHNRETLQQLRRLSKHQIHNFSDLFRLTSQSRTLH